MVHKSTLYLPGAGGVGSLNGLTGDVNITSTGGTIAVTEVGQNINLEVIGGGGTTYYTWQEVTTSSQQGVVNYAYILNNASRVVLTLPAVAAIGDKLKAVGKGAGGWQIAQNAGQTIHYDSNDTTTGVTGFLNSQRPFDCVELVCITANTDWVVHTSIGNITGN